MSRIPLDEDFLVICEEILNLRKTEGEWAEIESDDMFQRGKYCGGFEAVEGAFCFSYHESPKQEFWFQVSLNFIQKIYSEKISSIEARVAEK